MSEAKKQERRRSHRVDASLALQLHLGSADAEAGGLETINVSSTGIYFRSESYIEPMTKLAISFEVPTPALAPVSCEGIVARIVPELPEDAADGYEVAVFFTTIDADSLHNLEAYIDARLRS